ncbi:MAG TPA: ABC transporter permease [Mycobacterium sp.]|nr:ABC transporter permease [Mycobacterium sp.]
MTVTAERIKLQTTRSPLWTALAVVVVSLGFAAIQAVTALPYSAIPPERAASGVATFGVPVLMMLSALTITNEHRTGLIRTTFMATPRRVRVLGAKALVSAVFSGILTAIMTAGSIAMVRAIVTDPQGAKLSLTLPSVWRTIGAISLYAVLGAVLAVGLGALVRHSAAVIAILVLLPFVVEPLLGATPRIGARIGPLFPFANASTFTEVPWLQTFSMWWGPVGAALYFASIAAAVFVVAAVVVSRRDP